MSALFLQGGRCAKLYDEAGESIRLLCSVLSSYRGIYALLDRIVSESMAGHGLNFGQLSILYIIHRNQGIGVSDLAALLKISDSNMSMKVDQLVQSGLVERDRSTTDRRRVMVRLTTEGLNILNTAYGEDSSLMKRISAVLALEEKELQALLDMNLQILRKLQEV